MPVINQGQHLHDSEMFMGAVLLHPSLEGTNGRDDELIRSLTDARRDISRITNYHRQSTAHAIYLDDLLISYDRIVSKHLLFLVSEFTIDFLYTISCIPCKTTKKYKNNCIEIRLSFPDQKHDNFALFERSDE